MQRVTVTGDGAAAPPTPFAALARLLRRNSRAIRDALIVAGIGRALYYFFVQDIQPWTFAGLDARAYWRIDLAHPYAGSAVGEVSTYLYSPAFAQAMAPFSALPFELYFAIWTAVSLVILIWLLRPMPWVGLVLSLPIVYELCVGNIHFLLAGAVVLAFERPALWAFGILTKITPGIGLLWHVLRREWRQVLVAGTVTLAITAVSFLANPTAWADWIGLLLANAGSGEALPIRVAAAAALIVVGARTERRWLVPVAVWVSLPVVWINSWVILLAAVRLWRTTR